MANIKSQFGVPAWTNKISKKILLLISSFLLKISNLRNHLSFNGSDRRESHKSYKGASIKAYLSLQGLSYEVIFESM